MSLSSTGDLDKLNMIAEQLNDLTEQHLIGLLDDATYAFQLDDALTDLPEPRAPVTQPRAEAPQRLEVELS